MKINRERLWTKVFISTSIVNFVLMLSMYLLLVIMANYAIEVHHTNTSIAGLVSSIFIFGALIGRLYSGNQINYVGTKKALIIGITIFVLMCIFYFFSIGIVTLICVRLIQGIGVGIATTATGTIVGQVIPPSRHGEGIGYFSMSVVLSTAIGPLIGISFIHTFGYVSVFIFSLLMGGISLLLALTIEAPQVEKEKSRPKFTFNNFFEVTTIPIATVMLIIGFAYSSILSFITTFAMEINLLKAGGLYFLVYAIVVLLTRPFTGKLMDARGANSVIYPTIIMFAIGMLLLSQATTTFVFLLAAIIIGLGYGNFQSSSQALAIKYVPMNRMSLANSTYYIFFDFSLGLGPLLLGFFIPIIGFRGMYMVLSAVILFSVLVYYLLQGKKEAKKHSKQVSA